jgi:supervillin
LWIGEFANIIEKAKANEIYEWIRNKRDLGLRSSKSVIIESTRNDAVTEEFWRSLGGHKHYSEAVAVDEDEKFESLILDTNMVYRAVEEDSSCFLEPVKSYWGSVLSYNLLDEDEVFVFDFGAELYMWSGRNADSKLKKNAFHLAKQLFEAGFDYSNCDISPLKPQYEFIRNRDVDDSIPSFYQSDKRPHWTLFGRFSQNVETILFKEKFFDWPSASMSPGLKKLPLSLRLENSLAKKQKSCDNKTDNMKPLPSLEPIQGELLCNNNAYIENTVNLNLDNFNLGRGRHWYDLAERRGYDILTTNIKVWRVVETKLVECYAHTYGELYSTDTFVIKWQYKVVAVGFRTLKGELSQHQTSTGRDRQALFFWHGQMSNQNEKGASALLSMDLGDKSFRSMPHVQVHENKEHAAFVQLFSGKMIVLRSHDNTHQWRMFALRGGEIEEENHLVEVNLSVENLRSRTALILSSKLKTYIWYGCYASDLHRSAVKSCAKALVTQHAKTLKIESEQISELDEGFETDEFSSIFIKYGGQNLLKIRDNYYYSLLKFSNSLYDAFAYTPQLFHLFSTYGKFEAVEVLSPLRSAKMQPYPFFQCQLYDENQPSLFLFDNHSELYVWQGWFDCSSTNESESLTIAKSDDNSVKIRFDLERKCALQTAINYWNCKHAALNKEFRGYVVYAGVEPIEFTSLFPFWKPNKNAKNSNLNVSYPIKT